MCAVHTFDCVLSIKSTLLLLKSRQREEANCRNVASHVAESWLYWCFHADVVSPLGFLVLLRRDVYDNLPVYTCTPEHQVFTKIGF